MYEFNVKLNGDPLHPGTGSFFLETLAVIKLKLI